MKQDFYLGVLVTCIGTISFAHDGLGLQCYSCYSLFAGGREKEDHPCKDKGLFKSSSVVTCTRENSLVFRSSHECSLGNIVNNTWSGVEVVERLGQVPPDQKWRYGCAKIGVIGKGNNGGGGGGGADEMAEMQRFCMAVPAEVQVGEGCKGATKREWFSDGNEEDDFFTTVIRGDMGVGQKEEEGSCEGVSDDSIVTACFCKENKCNGDGEHEHG